MKIWLCKHSEQIALNHTDRHFRFSLISKELSYRNHEVIWWASRFSHTTKTLLPVEIDRMENGTKLILLEGIKYSRNLSIKRVINHYQLGKNFNEKSRKVEKPELIYASVPTLDFAYKAVRYALKNRIPIIIDILDLWPDVFKDLIPINGLKNNLIINYYEKKLLYILENASAIIGITEGYLNWAESKLSNKEIVSKVFPLGFENLNNITININKNDRLRIIFAGTIGYHFDLETVLKAASKLNFIDFEIVGDGDLFAKYKKAYDSYNNIHFHGWLEKKELHSLLISSDLGIAPYNNSKNFTLNIPNKPFEYLAHGLPVITCLKGETMKMLNYSSSGYFYKENNVNNLVDLIINISKNRDKLYQKSLSSIKIFNEKYNSDVIYPELCDFIEHIGGSCK